MRQQPFVGTEQPVWDRPGVPQGAWAETGLIPITIGAMVGCITLSAVTLLQRGLPGWNGTLVVLFCSVAAVEAAYSYRLYRRDLEPGPRRMLIQAVELTTLCVVRQVWETVVGGHAPLAGGVPRFDPLTAELFFLTSGLIFLSWLSATTVMRALDEPARPRRLDAYPAATQRRLAAWCLMGGLVLLFLAGLSQAPFAAVSQLPHPMRGVLALPHPVQPGPVLNVVLYSVLALALLGQAQYNAIARRNERREIVVADGFSGRLLRHTAPVIALAVILALLLPTTRLVSGGQAAWSNVAAAIGHVNMNPQLHGDSDQPPSHPITNGPPCCASDQGGYGIQAPPPTDTPRHTGNPFAFLGRLGPVLKFVLLWFVLLASLAYRIRRIRRRKLRSPSMPVPSFGLFDLLRGFWGGLWQGLRGSVPTLGEHLPREIGLHPHLPQPALVRPSFPRIRRLSPREHVVHSFLRFVREAEQRGFGRDPAHTPQEYSAHLSSHLTEGREDIQALAQAFVEARYSDHEVGVIEVERARASRKRARSALRSIKPE